jgi:hypothetical protein
VRHFIAILAFVILCLPSIARAQQSQVMVDRSYYTQTIPATQPIPTQPVVDQSVPRLHWLGFRLSLGVPSGVALELEGNPTRWLHLDVGGAYAGLGPVIVEEVGVDFFPFVISPVIDTVFGESLSGTVPGVQMPPISYTFETAMVGLRFGRRDRVGFVLEGGMGALQVSTSGFQSFLQTQSTSINGIVLSNPSASVLMLGCGRVSFFVDF